QRVSFVTIFEYRWKCLLDKYINENVINYLRRLYASKESWAKAFVLKLFTAGMSSTSRVESYNAKKTKKTEYALFRASVPKAALVATADSILPNVCKMLCKYLTVEMLKIQEDQIKQSLQYHATIVVQEELQRFLNINLDDPALFGENLTDIIAKSMLDLIDTNKIVEMWGVRRVISNETQHFVILLNDGTHLCSCLDHCNRGIVCRHFFQSVTMGWNGLVLYLNALNQGTVYEMKDINRKTIDERKLYGEAWGKARAALMLMNPHKRKGKGRPKGTNRIRRADELPKKAKRKLHCKICGGTGHNQ
ncbi:20400_t:CDS:2, partial [Cetraspora pellucida]